MSLCEKIRREAVEKRRRRRFTKRFVSLAGDLSALLSSGVPVADAVDYLEQQPSMNREAPVLLKAAREGIKLGQSLGCVWEPWLNPLSIAALELGTASGQLAVVLAAWAEQHRRQREWLVQVLRLLAYPALLFCGNLAVELLVAWVIVPEFKTMYSVTGARLTESSYLLMSAVEAMPAVLSLLLLTVVLFGVFGAWQARLQTQLWKWLLARMPGVRLVQAVRTQQICLLLRLLLEGGAPIMDALNTLANTGGSKWLQEKCSEIHRQLLLGRRLSRAFQQNLDPLLSSTLRVAEQTGDVPAALRQTDEFLQQHIRKQVEGVLKWVEPVLLLLLGGLIALTMYVLFVPMYEMISSISAATT